MFSELRNGSFSYLIANFRPAVLIVSAFIILGMGPVSGFVLEVFASTSQGSVTPRISNSDPDIEPQSPNANANPIPQEETIKSELIIVERQCTEGVCAGIAKIDEIGSPTNVEAEDLASSRNPGANMLRFDSDALIGIEKDISAQATDIVVSVDNGNGNGNTAAASESETIGTLKVPLQPSEPILLTVNTSNNELSGAEEVSSDGRNIGIYDSATLQIQDGSSENPIVQISVLDNKPSDITIETGSQGSDSQDESTDDGNGSDQSEGERDSGSSDDEEGNDSDDEEVEEQPDGPEAFRPDIDTGSNTVGGAGP